MSVAPRVLSRMLGVGGSSSRMIRRISSKAACLERLGIERGRAGQQLVEQDAQRVDVAAGVDVQARDSTCSGLMYKRRADELREGGVERSSR